MNAESELRQERAVLVKANLDISYGEERILKQRDLILHLHAGGHETREAERLLQLVQRTLTQWQDHRLLILQRIQHLEAAAAATAKSGAA